jgi:hypothetical protein
MEHLLEKIQQNINQRWERVEATTKVTIELMEEHLIQPAKVQTMIQAFMATLTRDMKTLTKTQPPMKLPRGTLVSQSHITRRTVPSLGSLH